MSWRHGLAAGELVLPDPTAKAVLNALAFHADDWNGQCWPDLDRLIQFTGLAKRSVQNGLRRLEQLNYVVTTTSKGRGYANLYTLKLPNVPPMRQTKKHAPDARWGAAGAQKDASAAPQESGRINEQTRSGDRGLHEKWRPDDETLTWAKAEWPDCDVGLELARFISVNLAKGEEIKNVRQAFRAWILRGKQLHHAGRQREAARRAAPGPTTSRLRSIAGGKDAGG